MFEHDLFPKTGTHFSGSCSRGHGIDRFPAYCGAQLLVPGDGYRSEAGCAGEIGYHGCLTCSWSPHRLERRGSAARSVGRRMKEST
jgi:hypothetical protein